jgi:hypothetical protein
LLNTLLLLLLLFSNVKYFAQLRASIGFTKKYIGNFSGTVSLKCDHFQWFRRQIVIYNAKPLHRTFCTHSLKISISWLSSECGNNDFPHAVFYFAAETRGNCIVSLGFNEVDKRKRQFTLNKMDVSSHL